MPITTLKVLASLLQLHGPGATIQSDHQGIDALLSDLRGQDACRRPRSISGEAVLSEAADAAALPQGADIAASAAFRRGGFIRGY